MSEVKRYDITGEMDGNCNLNEASMQVSEDGIYVKHKDYAALQQKLHAVVAENQMARQRHHFIRALGISITEHSGGRMDWRGAMQDATELVEAINAVYADTPATDVILNAVRAEGVDMFSKKCSENSKQATSDVLRDSWWVSGEHADDFAHLLRTDIKDARS